MPLIHTLIASVLSSNDMVTPSIRLQLGLPSVESLSISITQQRHSYSVLHLSVSLLLHSQTIRCSSFSLVRFTTVALTCSRRGLQLCPQTLLEKYVTAGGRLIENKMADGPRRSERVGASHKPTHTWKAGVCLQS